MSTLTPDLAGPHDPLGEAALDADLSRRRRLIWAAAQQQGADAVLAYGANRSGTAIGWLTGWPVTREALLVMRSPEDLLLLVGFFNHVPSAKRLARPGADRLEVRWCGPDPAATVLAALPTAPLRLGTVGALPAGLDGRLRANEITPVSLDAAHTRLRQVKSPLELAWLQRAAELTDAAARALVLAAVPGAHQLDLLAATHAAFDRRGGHAHVLYLCSTSMASPDRSVPAQYAEDRRLAPGDVVVFELSVAWPPDYPGQMLRTVVVEADPTPEYLAMHEVATGVHDEIVARLRPGAAPSDLLDAASAVQAAGFTCVDDLVHGLGGGYLPPVLSLREAPSGPHAAPLQAGMTVVVQPNVCSTDLTAGVQTGEMYLVAEDGARPLHDVARGILRGGTDPGRRTDEQHGR